LYEVLSHSDNRSGVHELVFFLLRFALSWRVFCQPHVVQKSLLRE